MTDQFVAVRAAEILAFRQERDAATAASLEGPDRNWWLVGLAMFCLGLTSGLAWWLLSNLPGFDPLPRVLG
jgi:hypothetical protein